MFVEKIITLNKGSFMDELRVEIHDMEGFNDEQRDNYIMGTKKMIIAMNSDQFKQRVLNYSYIDSSNSVISNFKSPYSGDKYFTRQEIYDYIMSGADDFDKEKDGDIDLYCGLYYKRWSSAIGYTDGTRWHYMNTRFFGDLSDHAEVAGNVSHEYMHKLGFTHAYKYNHTREHTVPYAIGYILSDLINDLDTPVQPVPRPEQPRYTLVKRCKRLWYTLWIKKKCFWVQVEK